ncbi:hypothetical protein BGZ65_011997, partial [Modicella reniformis]
MELDTLHQLDGEENKTDRNGTGSGKTKVSEKLLAPYHIYQALQSNPDELDFLTSQYEDMEGIGEMMVCGAIPEGRRLLKSYVSRHCLIVGLFSTVSWSLTNAGGQGRDQMFRLRESFDKINHGRGSEVRQRDLC